MIVNFENKFKSLLKTPGQRFLIDHYKTDSGKEGDFCAIWYKEKQTLDLTIYSTDSINCNNIEVFWRDPNSNTKNLAFTLIESEGMFLTNKGGNHFRIHFPETNSTILTESDNSNTDYLEGVNHLGCNFFKKDEVSEDTLITKASYEKFVRNGISVNNAPTYLNTSGEKIFAVSSYKKPKKVEIWFATKKGLSKYYVPGDSNTVYVEGTVTYDLYEVSNGNYKLVEENRTEGLTNTVLNAENIDESEIEIEINQLDKSISYTSTDSSSTIQVYAQLYFSNDLGDTSISSPMKSNVLELIQYKTIDLPSTSSNINPIGGNRVFLFDYKGRRLNNSSEDIDSTESNIHFIRFSVKNKPYESDINELLDKITTSNPVIWDFFDKEVEESYNPTTQTYTYDIKFSTKQENDSKTWYPLNSNQVSTLIPCAFSFNSNDTIGFYLVQGFVADIKVNPKLEDDPDSDGNYIIKFDGKLGKKSIDLYVTGDDVSDYNTWNISSGFLSGSDSMITKTSGNIETKQTSKHDTFSIVSYKNPSSFDDTVISNGIVISRYSNGDSGDWKNVMISQANKKTIKVILKKAQDSERVNSTTPYNFNSERLFLFDYKGYTFENTDDPENKTHTITFYTAEKFKNSGTDVLKIGEGLGKYFKFDLIIGDNVEELGLYKNQVNITTCFDTGDEKTLGQNLTDSCYPGKTPVESTITSEGNTIKFYVIQAINIPQLKLYIPDGRGIWKDIENEDGVTSTEKTEGVFRFDNKDEMNSYINTDKSFDEHKPGDIISSGEGSILVNDNFKILIQTYKEANSFIFNSSNQEVEFILSSIISDYKYWFLNNGIPEGLVINSTDKEINTELEVVDDQYYTYPYDPKNPKTTWKAPHSIILKNTVEQGVSEKIYNTLYFTRINTANPDKSDLIGSWEYYMCNNNNEGPAILNTKVESLENSISIDVSGGDTYLTDPWKNSRYFPLDHIGIYCIMVSCDEDFTVTISSHHNNSLFFYDETNDKILTSTYSIDKQRSSSGTPIYICFLGEQVGDSLFNSIYSSEFNETLRVSYRENSSVYKEVRFRRYYREGYPTTDGTNWGDSTSDSSTSNYLDATLTPIKNVGSSNILESVAARKDSIDLFRTPSMDTVSMIFDSNVELVTEGDYAISSSPTFRFANWSGNRTWNESKTSYVTGTNNGYQNTEVTLGSDIGNGIADYPSVPIVINVQHPRKYDDKGAKVLLYDLASAPILTLGEGINSTKLNFRWAGPTKLDNSTMYNSSSQTIYLQLYGPSSSVLESNFISSGLDNIAKVSSTTISDLGSNGEASVRISVTAFSEQSPTENTFLGTYTFTARLPYNKFLKDDEGNLRTDYTQEEVDQLAGTASISFDVWLLPDRDVITSIEGSFGLVPAGGEKRPFYLGKDSMVSEYSTVSVNSYDSIPGVVNKTYPNIGTTNYFEVEFMSRQKRFGYSSLINLNPNSDDKGISTTLIEKFIKDLSGSYIDDNFSVSVVGSSSTINYNTKKNGGILQDKVKTGILIGWSSSPQSTSISKWALVLGEATIEKETDYTNDCEYVFLASVELPIKAGAADFTSYNISGLKFSTNHSYMSVRLSPMISSGTDSEVLNKENVIVPSAKYNYQLYYVRSSTVKYNEIFYITDNSGNKLTFHVKQGYLY